MVRRQLDIYEQKNEFGPVLYIIYKKYSKYINDLNVNAKTTKLLEKKQRHNLYHLEFGNCFLDITPKTQQQKKQIN